MNTFYYNFQTGMCVFMIGTKVVFGIYPLHHNASVWGDDVEVCALTDDGWAILHYMHVHCFGRILTLS